MRNRISKILDAASSAHNELRSFTVVAAQGLGWASEATRIHELMTRTAAFGSDAAAQARHKDRAAAAEVFATGQRPLGFPYLWYLASVRLWTLLEVAVEDVVMEFLAVPDHIPMDSVVRRLEAPVLAFQALEANEKAETLINLLKEKTKSSLKPGVGRLEGVLDPVGLGGSVPDIVRRVVLELSQVRNLVVHKNAVVDRRFATQCPWVPCDVGQLLPINVGLFGLYGLGVDWYILTLERRADAALGQVPDPESNEVLRKLEEHLQEFWVSRPCRDAGSGSAA
jgi:hypothetical protein